MSANALETVGPPVAGNVPGTETKLGSGANEESVLYNGMVSPWVPFAIKAALWYQGEQNADQSCQANGTSHTDPVAYYATA